jgi:ubiquinone/menaquinone biosynthesis C-methylase UbiE
MSEIFLEQIIPEISPSHIDFGCGDGFGTFFQATFKPSSTIVGYDLDPSKIQEAQRRLEQSAINNLTFQKTIPSQTFQSATLNFVFHENPRAVREVEKILCPDGKIIVFDYNIKGISQRDFRKQFHSDNELRVLSAEGFGESYQKHTRYDLADCRDYVERAGFRVISQIALPKYFVLVADKTNE